MASCDEETESQSFGATGYLGYMDGHSYFDISIFLLPVDNDNNTNTGRYLVNWGIGELGNGGMWGRVKSGQYQYCNTNAYGYPI